MEDWTTAYDLCRKLARDCAELLTWEPVAKFALEGALRAHRELQGEKDEEWSNLALAYLRVCALIEDDMVVEELDIVLSALGKSETAHTGE